MQRICWYVEAVTLQNAIPLFCISASADKAFSIDLPDQRQQTALTWTDPLGLNDCCDEAKNYFSLQGTPFGEWEIPRHKTMMPGVGSGKRNFGKAHRGMRSCGSWKRNPLNCEKSQTDIDRKGYRTISAMASADFTRGQLNQQDSLVQMASSELQKDPGPADLSYNMQKMLQWWENKWARNSFLSTSVYLTVQNKQQSCLRLLCKARVWCSTNRNELQKQNCQTRKNKDLWETGSAGTSSSASSSLGKCLLSSVPSWTKP